MTDEEIIEKIIRIQVVEGLSQQKLANLLRVSRSTLCTILNGKQRITNSRRKFFLMAFKMYNEGLLK